MTELVDASTGAVTRQSFDAWGNKRDVSDWTIPATYNLFADRGFTGHEHLEEFELINMNGRVYDPALGRFLSPDPYVQMPDFSQSFNRYSYCLNNPLVYTDPSGDFFFIIPSVNWSPSGGLDVSVTVGIGFPNLASVQATVGYGGGNFYTTVGASLAGLTGYAGYGTKSGWFAGASYGFNPSGFASNMTSVGINYSQNGGWSANYLGVQISKAGSVFDPSIGVSHRFSNEKYFYKLQDGIYLEGPEMTENQVENEYKSFNGVGEGEAKIGDISTSPGRGFRLTGDHVFAKSENDLNYAYVARRQWSFREIYDVHISPYATRDIYFLRGVFTHEHTHVLQHYFRVTYLNKASSEVEACLAEIDYYLTLLDVIKLQHNISGMIKSANKYLNDQFK